ncbi:FkbM family methyltransferase [Campylobacter concisus]|uniref:FkbM family methyltransferase n=1 Tax=Campylobacter concisus TaxID=199 RepID=UPI001901B868|nr:FkbM family methyltransferase [Campylobacter concisus]
MKIQYLRIFLKEICKNQDIDFLSVDVEGLDLMVLRSNNFEKYKPKIVLIEILGNSFSEIENNKIADHLNQYGYSIFTETINTVFL